MDKKKMIMLVMAVVFLIAVILVAYDMGRQTTSPWKKKELIKEKYRVK